MKRNRINVFVALSSFSILILLFSAGCEKADEITFESQQKKIKISETGIKRILIVHSYHKGWGWNQDTEKGVIKGLNKCGYVLDKNYQLKTFYMDTKVTYVTPRQIKARADEALKLIEEFDPDLVITNDDNALKYVAVPYSIKNPEKKLPFVFSGVNADPTIYSPIESLEKPGHNITGALERFPFYQCFSLAKQILHNRSSIVLMGDSSPSSSFVFKAFRERYLQKVKKSPLEVKALVQVKTFEEWKLNILEYQNKTDFLGIITYHQLKDKNGKFVPPSEVVLWTINHSNLPELGFLLFHSEDGFWMSVGVSPFKTGIYIGKLSGDILNGKDPGNIAIVDPKRLDIAFNLERSEMLDIKIPIEILNMATITYREIKRPRF